jgi:hypothetical protein
MARNRFADKHLSYKKRNMSPSQVEAKRQYDKEYSSSEERKKYRVKLNKKNREKNTYGNGDKKDLSHTTEGNLFKNLNLKIELVTEVRKEEEGE